MATTTDHEPPNSSSSTPLPTVDPAKDASKPSDAAAATMSAAHDAFGLPVRVRAEPDPAPATSGVEPERRHEDETEAAAETDGRAAWTETEEALPERKDDEKTETAKTNGTTDDKTDDKTEDKTENSQGSLQGEPGLQDIADQPVQTQPVDEVKARHRSSNTAVSEWSHQQLTVQPEAEDDDDGGWQEMPAFAPFDMYDDDNRLIAREAAESDNEEAYNALGGAGNGYTRVQLDEDAQSATSLDENTQYLFGANGGSNSAGFEDDDARDAVSQMQATKDLLTEGQRIAYVGMARLVLFEMVKDLEKIDTGKHRKKEVIMAIEAGKMWSQKMIVRLYAHMDISSAEQIMIEQLSEHGVQPGDMTPTLMQNARVKNPMAESEPATSLAPTPISSTRPSQDSRSRSPRLDEQPASPLPAYEEHDGELDVKTPMQLPTTAKIDIDLRWTVLCDLFLTLIADSIYDSRSRALLERVGTHLSISPLDICRFEKRVTDALEMQQQAETENWNEAEHMENRRKLALRKRYMLMGLATVGGGLVIGLSAGLLAPVIGAGLAAGFSTIGVAGTSGFLAGAGGAAIITTSSAAAGGIIAVKAANRRTGAVKTFEYRPLHNNKRVNLIVTVAGWMTGKVDDVRLPFSTVDPIMGDIYSVLWEPEMLRSMGDTINILATEALTQGLQQLLGSTILISLMAALQLPVVLSKLAYLIDNPWSTALDRATAAGLILADSLIDRNLGTRPVTFVGYSLGSRVIFSCLKELARKGAYGLVQNVYLFGSPVVANKDDYRKARGVVSGRFVNGYAKNDWILGYLFRLTSGGISSIAGLAPVPNVPGIEHFDVTDLVPGHMSYRQCMPRLLRELGWSVESDEFSEIEDPDPENHSSRQRELINEIEGARRELEKQDAPKSKFGFFSRKKKTERKEWETYQVSKPDDPPTPTTPGADPNVLFDIDAIRAELAREHDMEIREIKSTLPPMKLDVTKTRSVSAPVAGLHAQRGAPRDRDRTYNEYSIPEEEVQMTFDTAYDAPAERWASQTSSRSASRSASRERSRHNPYRIPEEDVQLTFDTAYRAPAATRSEKPLPFLPGVAATGLPPRPELRSASSVPGVGRNAWADDDDDDDDDGDVDFGKEEEIQMTFA